MVFPRHYRHSHNHHIIPVAHHAVSHPHHVIPATITSFPSPITPCPATITPFPQPSRRAPQPSHHSHTHHAVPRNHHIIPTPITSFPQPSRHSRVGGNLAAYVRSVYCAPQRIERNPLPRSSGCPIHPSSSLAVTASAECPWSSPSQDSSCRSSLLDADCPRSAVAP